MTNEDREQLHKSVMLGDECDQFCKFPLVREYLSGRAAQEEQEVFEQMLDTDPADAEAIRKCQDAIKSLRRTFRWINEAMQIGDMSIQRIIEEG